MALAENNAEAATANNAFFIFHLLDEPNKTNEPPKTGSPTHMNFAPSNQQKPCQKDKHMFNIDFLFKETICLVDL